MLGPRRLYLLRFLFHHRRWPKLNGAIRISDKIAGRILSGQSDTRRLQLTDKLQSRQVVAQACPGIRVKQIFAVYESAEELSLDDLPERFVLKPNNASGINLLVYDRHAVSELELRSRIAPWFKLDYYHVSQEPCYREISARVFAEELLSTEDGRPPGEFQIYCIHGRVAFLEYQEQGQSRIEEPFFDRDWRCLSVWYPRQGKAPRMARPALLEQAISVAEAIAAGLDFLRVDLYDMPDGSLVFAEVANSPWGGLFRLEPEEGDALLGSYWEPYQADESAERSARQYSAQSGHEPEASDIQ
jgi:hypothetical protein